MTVCKLVTETAKKKVPVLKWLPEYNSEKLVSDMIAGVTVGLTVIPQGLAYATLAGLEPQYGLYSAFMGCFVYAIFGSCKDITIGPTALMSLMTYQQVVNRNADFAVLLCFLSGCIQVLLSILNLGVLVDFISIPVTVGFTSATSVIIAVSQIKGLLGLKFTSSGFIDTIKQIGFHITETRLNDSLLGFSCIIILLLMRKMKDIPVGSRVVRMTDRQRIVKKTFWLISTSRNALVVLVCSLIAFLLYDRSGAEPSPFILTGPVKSGLPEFGPPPFTSQVGNRTYSFVNMCSEMSSAIILVPVIAVLGNVAIAKAFSSGESIDATQELLTLGLCNLVGSFASSMPITGSFSRSAVNHASGVRTPLGGVYTGATFVIANVVALPLPQNYKTFPRGSAECLAGLQSEMESPLNWFFRLGLINFLIPLNIVDSRLCFKAETNVNMMQRVLIILALSTLTPYFFYIPKASLAAVIICAVIFMIEYEVVKPMWKSNRKDLIPTFATFILCLLIGVEYGILVGVAINIVFLLYPSARPNVRVEKKTTMDGSEYLLVTPGNSLYFPAVDYIRTSVCRAAAKEGSIPVIIDCRYVLGADFTAAKGIAALIDDFNKRGQPIYFYQPCANVVEVFKGANMEEFIHVCNEEELDSVLSSKSAKRKLSEEYGVKIEDLREASRLVSTP